MSLDYNVIFLISSFGWLLFNYSFVRWGIANLCSNLNYIQLFFFFNCLAFIGLYIYFTIVIQPHSGPLLDVDWWNNNAFSTSSTICIVYVCKVCERRQVKGVLQWNNIHFHLYRLLFIFLVQIWNIKQQVCLHDFRDHHKVSIVVLSFSLLIYLIK